MDKLFKNIKNFAKSRETKSPEDIFIEDDEILCEANALTSVLVDFIHGKHKQNRQHRDLLEDIIDLSIYYIGEIEKLDSNNSKRKYFLWHNLCRLRRIVSILNKAINQEYIDYDDNISRIMIVNLVNLKSKLNAIVKAEAYKIAKIIDENSEKSDGSDVDWTDVAIIYESTLILRHSALAGTLSLTNLALSIKKDASENEIWTKIIEIFDFRRPDLVYLADQTKSKIISSSYGGKAYLICDSGEKRIALVYAKLSTDGQDFYWKIKIY